MDACLTIGHVQSRRVHSLMRCSISLLIKIINLKTTKMLKNYLKTMYRSFLNNKTFSLLNIAGLAIGIACAGFIFLWVEDELNYNSFFADGENIYSVKDNQTYDGTTFTFDATPGPLAPAMQQEIPGIQSVSRSSWPLNLTFSLGDKALSEQGRYVDSSFTSIFHLKIIRGSLHGVFSELHSVVISRKLAENFFGRKDPVGQTLKVDNKNDFIIRAVFEDLPTNVTVPFNWLASYHLFEGKNSWLRQWNSNGVWTFVKLQPHTDLTAINKKLYSFIQTKNKEAVAKIFLFPLKKWRLYNQFVNGREAGGRIRYVELFTTIAWIILLIACINFMNLATARSEKRAREVGVRKVMGARKKMLVIQFISESITIALVAAFVSIGLMYLLMPSFNLLIGKTLSVSIENTSHLFSLLLIALICGVLAGSYPAFYLSSFNPVMVLKAQKMNTGLGAVFIRKGLVILQFSISLILIISTILIYEQISYARQRDLGYAKDKLVYVELNGNMHKSYYPIRDEMIKTGLVENATISSSSILQFGSNTGGYSWPGKDPSKQVLITVESITPDYIPTMGIHIKKGRNFYNNIPADSNNVIINRAFEKIIGKKDAVGIKLVNGGSARTVIGVVDDFVYNNMYATPSPMIMFSDTSYANYLTIRISKNADVKQTLSKLGSIIRANNPGYPVEFKFVEEQFEQLFKTETLVGRLAGIFSALAILISCFGLFGLAGYTAERRTKEIGIRKVLGASIPALARLLSVDFLKLVAISCLIAFPVAWWYMYKWLQDYQYRITIQWWIFLASGIICLLIAMVTVSFQAIKTALADPAKSLRTE
ncbi:MAG: FtsX-like permease family protein [Chitinophagaceae bacterium]|nr:FtsX-like permease family protein [Chitinophagaceae bacterium]